MEENYNKDTSTSEESQSTTGEAQHRTFKGAFKEGSPDDVKHKVKDAVSKGVAAVAGALKGFTDESQKQKLPEESKNAITQAAETTKSTTSTLTEQVQGLKEPLKEATQKVSETVRDVSQTTKQEVRQTKETIKGGASGGAGAIGGGESMDRSTSGYGSTSLGATSTGLGGSSATGQGSEFPDISKTPLAESDKKLQNKDLRELEE